MRLLSMLVLATSAMVASAPVSGMVHGEMLCWVPDVEFPIVCDEDGDEEDDDAETNARDAR